MPDVPPGKLLHSSPVPPAPLLPQSSASFTAFLPSLPGERSRAILVPFCPDYLYPSSGVWPLWAPSGPSQSGLAAGESWNVQCLHSSGSEEFCLISEIDACQPPEGQRLIFSFKVLRCKEVKPLALATVPANSRVLKPELMFCCPLWVEISLQFPSLDPGEVEKT